MPGSKAPVPRLPPARHVSVGDCSIAYFTAGPDDGAPLVLCHGLAANGLQFAADAAWFGARGFRVIVPDVRGHGRSTCPAARRDADFSIPRLAADMIAILEAERIEAADWVGNSLGGVLVLSLMGTDRSRLKRFVSFGTAYALAVPGALAPFTQLGYRVIGREGMARLGARMTCRDAPARAVIHAMLRQIDVDAVRRIAGHAGRYDLTENALRFGGPILMIRGARDVAVNLALAPTLAAMTALPNFSVIDMAGASHCANLDRPAAVREAILKFLTGH
jgi:3-oxoadipate enol-lactonase